MTCTTNVLTGTFDLRRNTLIIICEMAINLIKIQHLEIKRNRRNSTYTNHWPKYLSIWKFSWFGSSAQRPGRFSLLPSPEVFPKPVDKSPKVNFIFINCVFLIETFIHRTNSYETGTKIGHILFDLYRVNCCDILNSCLSPSRINLQNYRLLISLAVKKCTGSTLCSCFFLHSVRFLMVRFSSLSSRFAANGSFTPVNDDFRFGFGPW